MGTKSIAVCGWYWVGGWFGEYTGTVGKGFWQGMWEKEVTSECG